MNPETVRVAAFYEFKELTDLPGLRSRLLGAMSLRSILGTIIIAPEGYNGTVSGSPEELGPFLRDIGAILESEVKFKESLNQGDPFRRRFVKIKKEIVTLRRDVRMELGHGTHVSAQDWNELIKRDDVLLLDTRNHYEYRVGTFRGAVDPHTERFSDLPRFVEANLDPARIRNVAMFCTGGIRCEKFVPYMKELGFENVFQLDGGILKYLEVVPADESLWEGECFVFDERITLGADLRKGEAPDFSAEMKKK